MSAKRNSAGVSSAKIPNADIGRIRALYETMVKVRACESALVQLFADGEVPGFIHLSHGQEAVSAGVCAALEKQDTLATTHRGHGHVIARGIALDAFFKELMGRETGICAGRSGSMHVADMNLGILGANGIVGASLPLALGSALGHQMRNTGGVATAFFGDGAMAEGSLHEALNIAALWKLPLLFVCENNGWSEFSPTDRQFKGALAGLASAFGLHHRRIDGNDVEAVSDAAEEARRHARKSGAFVLECMTSRVRGHFEGDPQKYRDQSEMSALGEIDPIARCKRRLTELGQTEASLKEIEAGVDAAVAEALTQAREAPLPDFALAMADVYTPEGVWANG